MSSINNIIKFFSISQNHSLNSCSNSNLWSTQSSNWRNRHRLTSRSTLRTLTQISDWERRYSRSNTQISTWKITTIWSHYRSTTNASQSFWWRLWMTSRRTRKRTRISSYLKLILYASFSHHQHQWIIIATSLFVNFWQYVEQLSFSRINFANISSWYKSWLITWELNALKRQVNWWNCWRQITSRRMRLSKFRERIWETSLCCGLSFTSQRFFFSVKTISSST